MTKQELRERMYKLGDKDRKLINEIAGLFNEVLVDFKSRTCGNCKHHRKGCYIQDRLELYNCSPNFGCNKFIRKENE